jgi:hypothetical protein
MSFPGAFDGASGEEVAELLMAINPPVVQLASFDESGLTARN